MSYPNVLGIQTVLTPGRCYAAVQAGAWVTHIQLIFISLCGYILPCMSSSEQELQWRTKQSMNHSQYMTVLISINCLQTFYRFNDKDNNYLWNEK